MFEIKIGGVLPILDKNWTLKKKHNSIIFHIEFIPIENQWLKDRID